MGRSHHHRFFVPPEEIRDGTVRLSAAQAHQIARVLRLKPGDPIQVFDGTGREIRAELVTAASSSALARAVEEWTHPAGPGIRIALAQVAPRGSHMDLIVAKATELGVARIALLETAHSVLRGTGRLERWRRIAAEAAEQCGRSEIPALAIMGGLAPFLASHPPAEPLLLLDAGAEAAPLPAVCGELAGATALSLLVGSEGGFDPEEVARCRTAGARLAWLGPRLLRSETAALAALAVIQATLGDGALR